MNPNGLQEQVFQSIKDSLPPHISLVDEIAAALGVSTDSAYRRIRGEKPLSLEEAHKLCAYFHLSLDRMLHFDTEGIMFTGSFVQLSTFRFDQYLRGVAQQIKQMAAHKEKQIYYLCKDIPLFHHFHFRPLAAFKHYVWMKGIFDAPEFAHRKFSLKEYPDELFELGRKTLDIYHAIDSVEIWNLESINSTMRQIDFYHDSGLFKDEREVIEIYEALEQLMHHFEQQADEGFKFHVGGRDHPGASFQMYLNELVIGDNSILAILDGVKTSLIIHTVINIMTTKDIRFCDNMYSSMQNLMRQSTLISTVSERERARFFKNLRKRIVVHKEKLKI